jgi:hypothetical protein
LVFRKLKVSCFALDFGEHAYGEFVDGEKIISLKILYSSFSFGGVRWISYSLLFSLALFKHP